MTLPLSYSRLSAPPNRLKLEPMIRIELMNLVLTKDALYQLSYIG